MWGLATRMDADAKAGGIGLYKGGTLASAFMHVMDVTRAKMTIIINWLNTASAVIVMVCTSITRKCHLTWGCSST